MPRCRPILLSVFVAIMALPLTGSPSRADDVPSVAGRTLALSFSGLVVASGAGCGSAADNRPPRPLSCSSVRLSTCCAGSVIRIPTDGSPVCRARSTPGGNGRLFSGASASRAVRGIRSRFSIVRARDRPAASRGPTRCCRYRPAVPTCRRGRGWRFSCCASRTEASAGRSDQRGSRVTWNGTGPNVGG